MAPFATALKTQTAPFDACAETYDAVFTESRVGRAQRASVWRELDRQFNPGQRILEINCGTCADALHLAESGVRVVACDASGKMISVALSRISKAGLSKSVDLRILRTEDLWLLDGRGIFDGALSNFGGLNCVEDLSSAGRDLGRLLKPGAKLVICVFGRWCAWEIAWHLAHGNPRKAFRRQDRNGAVAHLNGAELRIVYPAVRDLSRAFAPYFRLKSRQGVGVLVPPTYLEPLAFQFPRAFRNAEHFDRALSRIPVVRIFADHILLTFERIGD
ncbi:MAG: class I SAM-dependent methyltransferase [Deltaproteobacteria bacterium]